MNELELNKYNKYRNMGYLIMWQQSYEWTITYNSEVIMKGVGNMKDYMTIFNEVIVQLDRDRKIKELVK